MAKKSGMGKFILGAIAGIGIGALLSPKSGKALLQNQFHQGLKQNLEATGTRACRL